MWINTKRLTENQIRFMCGLLLGLVFLLPAESSQAAQLSIETSHPVHSTYVLGEKVELKIKVAGFAPAASGIDVKLTFLDANDNLVDEKNIACNASADGTWETVISAPADKLGFYRVKAALSTGETIAELGTRKSGYITYAVMPDPAKRGDCDATDAFYGLQGAFNHVWRDEIIHLLGPRWLLEGFAWDGVEPARAGQFAEALAAKKIPTEPRKAGKWQTYPLICLSPIPKWAAKPETYSYNTGALTPEGEQAWVEFCRNAARVQLQRFPHLKQRIYQVTWEPVVPWGFKGTDQELIRIYELAYPILHEVDPGAVVAGPTKTLENQELDNTVKILKAGLGKYIDALAIHPYYSADAEDSGYVESVRRLQAAVDQYVRPGTPILGTEQGSPTKEVIAKEIIQANTLMRYNLISLGEGFQFNFSFYIHDFRTGGQLGQGFYYNLTSNFAWGPEKISPKPVAPAFAAQTLLLEGHRPVRSIEWLGSTALGYAFAKQDHIVLALWDFGGSRTVSLPVGTSEVTVYDMMGNSRNVPAPGGDLQLKIGADPIYIEGVSPKLWGSAGVSQISVKSEEPAVCPGESIIIDGVVTASGASGLTLLARAAEELGGGVQKLEIAGNAGKESAFRFELKVPPKTTAGRYPVSLVLQSGTEARAVSGIAVRVLEPVKIVRMEPQLGADNRPSIRLQLLNQTNQTLSGIAKIEVAGTGINANSPTIEIAAGETRSVAVELNSNQPLLPIKRYQVEATVALANGMQASKVQPLNFLTTAQVNAESTTQVEWGKIAPIRVAGREAVIRGADQYYKNDEDLSAVLKLAWSAKALLLHVEVQDDQFCQPFNTTDLWRGDCLQIGFNLDPFSERQKETGNRAADEAKQQRRHTEINVGLTRDGPQAYRSFTFNVEKLPRGLIANDRLPVSVQRNGNVTVYDVVIPWAALGLEETPTTGQVIGFGMTVNDADANDQKEPKALGVFGGIHPSKNPDKFGLMLLGPSLAR